MTRLASPTEAQAQVQVPSGLRRIIAAVSVPRRVPALQFIASPAWISFASGPLTPSSGTLAQVRDASSRDMMES